VIGIAPAALCSAGTVRRSQSIAAGSDGSISFFVRSARFSGRLGGRPTLRPATHQRPRCPELCGVRIGDIHWESGQWGRFLVHGKGARGSGPRQREAYLFEEGRVLLWWYMEEVRAEFCDVPDNPEAPLFPSERIPQAVTALNVETPGIAVTPSTIRAGSTPPPPVGRCSWR
jgi:hypothetical protein